MALGFRNWAGGFLIIRIVAGIAGERRRAGVLKIRFLVRAVASAIDIFGAPDPRSGRFGGLLGGNRFLRRRFSAPDFIINISCLYAWSASRQRQRQRRGEQGNCRLAGAGGRTGGHRITPRGCPVIPGVNGR